MADFDYGAELAAARRRAGLSIQQVSNSIRIRPDILRALETQNFDKMPAKGFARNQVSAYARFLGLDPIELTRQFLIAYTEFERQAGRTEIVLDRQLPDNSRTYTVARKSATMSEENKALPGYRRDYLKRRTSDKAFEDSFSDSRNSRSGRTQSGRSSSARRGQRGSSHRSSNSSSGRSSSYNSSYKSRNNSSLERNSSYSRTSGSSKSQSGRSVSRVRLSQETYNRPKRKTNGRPYVRQPVQTMGGSRGRHTNTIGSSGFRPSGRGLSKKRLILIAALIVVLILVIMLIVRCSSSADSSSDSDSAAASNTVQVTGGSDSSTNVLSDSTDDASSDDTDDDDAADSSDSSFTVVVTVADGYVSWVQVTADDETVTAETITGPEELTYTPASNITLSIGNASAVTVTVDGEETDLDTDSNGLGSLTLTYEDGEVVRG